MAGNDHTLSKLSAPTVRLISSGQVITSVFSVVKELFENSLDASAKNIDIRLDDHGLERIEVCDDGKGIRKQDVPFMAKRHFTSKLTQMDDFLSLETYGFRGEALASLCAVADVTVTTKTAEDDFSSVYSFDGEGCVKNSKPSHLGRGTTVTALHLFDNLPVRKQYYKSSQRKKDDLRKIEDLLTVFGITKPNLRIRLKHGSDLIFQKLPMPDSKSVLHTLLGRQVASNFLFKEQNLEELKGSISAFIPKPGLDVKTMSRANSDRTFIVVNDRPVHVKDLVRVLRLYYMNCHACESTRFPLCFVSIKLPIPDVDVNLEPNKTAVLLRPMVEVSRSLEEMLLQVYGPLDNAPSWRYADDNDNKVEGKQEHSKSTNKKQMPKASDILWDSEQLSTRDPHQSEANKKRPSEEDNSHKTLHIVPHNSNNSCPLQGEQPTNVIVNHSEAQPSIVIVNHSDTRPADMSVKPTERNLPSFIADNDDDLLLLDTVLRQEFPQSSNQQASKNDETSRTELPISLEERGVGGNRTNSVVLEGDSNSKSSAIGGEKDGSINHQSTLHNNGNDSEWSRGHVTNITTGTVLQPVQLLAPTSKQTPGKRPMSPSSEDSGQPALKQRSTPLNKQALSPNQSQLPFLVSKSPSVSDPGNSNSPNTSMPAERQTTPVEHRTSKFNVLPVSNKNISKTSVRDQVAKQASQSQSEKPKKCLRSRLYKAERNIHCAVRLLRQTATQQTDRQRMHFPKPVVLGQAKDCDAWMCCTNNTLGVVNVHRLAESLLYTKLRAKHKLPSSGLEEPIPLTLRNLTEPQLETLRKLGKECQASGTFDVTDRRLLANGFDVKLNYATNGQLEPELFGVCNLVPTYGVPDLSEVLDKLLANPDYELADVRPSKALYYLQGEAARMTLQNSSVKSPHEVAEMLEQFTSHQPLDTAKCFHQRPLFKSLFDLNDLCLEEVDDNS